MKDTLGRKKKFLKKKIILKFMGVELDSGEQTLNDYNIYNPEAGTDELLEWCQEMTKGYEEVAITDFVKSWKDGLGFACLVHKHREDLIDWKQMKEASVEKRLVNAFASFENMGVNMIMELEDVLGMEVLDRLSVITFLGELRNRFTHVLVLEQKK